VDRELVERARSGDHDAFEVLAASIADRCYGIARLILRDADRAEDAAQEALVRCWRDLPSLREVDRFDAWLNRLLMPTAAVSLSICARSLCASDLRATPLW
jgi:RNA polymerase sigma-70 factor (ECF subfamily)